MKRAFILLPIIALLLVTLVVLASNAALNTAPIRTNIQDAIQRATGREARIHGRFAIAWSLTPTVAIEDVALLNPPGYSSPELLTIRRIEASLALLPLLQGRIEIPTLSIQAPDLRFDRDPAGQGNWQQPTPPPPPSATPASPPTIKTPIIIRHIHVERARLEWASLPPLAITTLDLAPAGGPLSGTATYDTVPITLSGTTGPQNPTGPDFDLTATTPAFTLTAKGQGPAATIRLTIPDLAAAGALAKRPLPPLKDVVLTANATPAGLTAIQLSAGPSDLATLLPSLRLTTMAAIAGAPDQPVHATAEAQLDDLAFTLVLDTGPILGPPTQPIPLSAKLTADDATATIQGTLDRTTNAPELTVAARIPDLQRLGQRTKTPLPALTGITLEVRLRPGPSAGVLARALRITSAQGDLAGDLAIATTPRPAIRGSLIAQRLDLDAWTAIPPTPPPAAPALTTPAPPPTPTPTPAPWLIPDRPLPLAALRRLDTDLRLAVATLQSQGATYRNLETRLLLQDGHLHFDPLTLTTPGGPLQATLEIDAAATPPTAALTLQAPAIDAVGLASTLGHPGALTGAANLDIDLRARGATPHALAATLSGRLAATMTDGDVANDLLATLFGPALRGVGIPLDPAGRSRIRCLGLRVEAEAGQAKLPLIALDTTRLRLEGDGQLDLERETMDLHLRPTLRLGPMPITLPVSLTGPMRAPKIAADKDTSATGRFRLSIGATAPDPCASPQMSPPK